MIKRLLPLLLAGLAVPALGAAPPSPPVDADPSLWVVRDADTTIYLFGTIHALDAHRDWFNDEVRTAFDRSNELVVEVVTPEDPAALQPLVAKYGLNATGPTLSSKLSPSGRQALARELQNLGMAPTAFDRFKPFFASITLSTLQFMKMGLDPSAGAELVLRKAAAAAGKPVGELETLDFQLGLFDALPEAEQIKLLESSLEGSDQLAGEMNALLDAWSKGDADSVAAMIKQDDGASPALYRLLIHDRNARWAEWIDQRLDQPGTLFIAVGAGHLAGGDSVQHLLARRGIASARVPHVEP